jgi:Na+/glutamate symporter
VILKNILLFVYIASLTLIFIIQAFFFVAFELLEPAFLAEVGSNWYESFFMLTLPLNIFLLYRVSKIRRK